MHVRLFCLKCQNGTHKKCFVQLQDLVGNICQNSIKQQKPSNCAPTSQVNFIIPCTTIPALMHYSQPPMFFGTWKIGLMQSI